MAGKAEARTQLGDVSTEDLAVLLAEITEGRGKHDKVLRHTNKAAELAEEDVARNNLPYVHAHLRSPATASSGAAKASGTATATATSSAATTLGLEAARGRSPRPGAKRSELENLRYVSRSTYRVASTGAS